jgi:hypothetical protein
MKNLLMFLILILAFNCSDDNDEDYNIVVEEEIILDNQQFFDTYYEYYAGVELITIVDGEKEYDGIFTGTVYEFTKSEYYYKSGIYRFVLFNCNDFDQKNGWCLSVGEEYGVFLVTITDPIKL